MSRQSSIKKNQDDSGELLHSQIVKLQEEIHQLRDFVMSGGGGRVGSGRSYSNFPPQMILRDEALIQNGGCCSRLWKTLVFLKNIFILCIFTYMTYRVFYGFYSTFY